MALTVFGKHAINVVKLKPMEYHQRVQNRAAQTVAVINSHLPTLKVAGVDATGLQAQRVALSGLAQGRDDALANADTANNAEQLACRQIRNLVVDLPKNVEGELSNREPAEAALLDLLAPAYAINPRTTALALQRGMILKSALVKINTYLAAQTPVRGPISSASKGVADLAALMDAQPARQQAAKDKAADVSSARTALATATTTVDRLNKRFYAKLQSEGRSNPALAAAMTQILTESANLPGTLSIDAIVQGGTEHLHLLVSYAKHSYNDSNTNVIEWLVAGVDNDFTHSAAADPSGNPLGPSAVGQTVKLRTRVTKRQWHHDGQRPHADDPAAVRVGFVFDKQGWQAW
jgi:hypothetical protein